MRTLGVVLMAMCVACSGNGNGGTGGGSGGASGGTAGSGGSGGGSGGSGGSDAGTPRTTFTVTGGLDASIATDGPTAAFQVSNGLSGVQFVTLPATVYPAIVLGVTRQGQLTTGALDLSTTPSFTCAISVSDGTHYWLGAVADAGTPKGTCAMQLTGVSVRFSDALGVSYAVHGSLTASALPGDGGQPVSLSATF
ncbi:MAG: hypothetical protein IPJ65_36135 [Archangiaceae bacterium]|nr:hypothetical protein [Archangiaceae bacterium]